MSARADLCGGRSVMIVPTATSLRLHSVQRGRVPTSMSELPCSRQLTSAPPRSVPDPRKVVAKGRLLCGLISGATIPPSMGVSGVFYLIPLWMSRLRNSIQITIRWWDKHAIL
jgi:hypothetical protein